jgi:DNA-binding MarR family transcriptional regulator
MSDPRQWLDLGLDALPADQAERVRLFRTLSAGAAMLRARLDREMAATGITTQQAGMLQFIEAQAAPPTIGAVATGLSMTHQNVKQIALALERKGFLVIEVDAQDRRARRLVTTAQHRRFWARRNPNDFAQVQAWTGGLTDSEVSEAVRLLRKLIAGLPPAA